MSVLPAEAEREVFSSGECPADGGLTSEIFGSDSAISGECDKSCNPWRAHCLRTPTELLAGIPHISMQLWRLFTTPAFDLRAPAADTFASFPSRTQGVGFSSQH
jgi:hypothetical protein